MCWASEPSSFVSQRKQGLNSMVWVYVGSHRYGILGVLTPSSVIGISRRLKTYLDMISLADKTFQVQLSAISAEKTSILSPAQSNHCVLSPSVGTIRQAFRLSCCRLHVLINLTFPNKPQGDESWFPHGLHTFILPLFFVELRRFFHVICWQYRRL